MFKTVLRSGKDERLRLEEVPLPDGPAVKHALDELESCAGNTEFLLVGCLLHDLGMTDRHRNSAGHCFAGDSALAAAALMRKAGWPERQTASLADMICLHMNGHITPADGHEAHLLQQGAACDIAGTRYYDFHSSYREGRAAKTSQRPSQQGIRRLHGERKSRSPCVKSRIDVSGRVALDDKNQSVCRVSAAQQGAPADGKPLRGSPSVSFSVRFEAMEIRLATTDDVAAISQLAYSLSAKYIAIDFDHEGARNLLASMETTAIEGYLRSGFRYHIAEENGIILGVVGVRENKHLYHLFVTETRQKQGPATELWRVAREACIAAGNPGEFTVSSSRLGLPFYAKLGFVQVGNPENRRGVIATPMKLTENEPNTSPKRTPKSVAA